MINTMNSIKTCRRFCLVVSVWLTNSIVSVAGVMIDIPNASLVAGTNVSIDIQVTGASDEVRGYDFEFLLTPLGGASTTLRFVNPQNESQGSNSNYIFSW